MVKDMRCALCRTIIAATTPRRVINGESYHAGCWDRRLRQWAAKAAKKPRGKRRSG
jgi:hypothetical protein